MRYLINIIGPQAVGKTTVIAELKEYLPEYRVLAIDDFRRQYDSSTPEGEMRAWQALLHDARSYERIIIESSGTSHNLNHVLRGVFKNDPAHIFTIRLEANVILRSNRVIKRDQQGYVNPPMYFEIGGAVFRKAVLPIHATFNTESEQPFEVAAQIFDLLPSEFV